VEKNIFFSSHCLTKTSQVLERDSPKKQSLNMVSSAFQRPFRILKTIKVWLLLTVSNC